MEVLYIVWQEEGEEAARHALRLMDSFAVGWVSCEPTILEIAARIKARSISKKRFPNSLFWIVNRISNAMDAFNAAKRLCHAVSLMKFRVLDKVRILSWLLNWFPQLLVSLVVVENRFFGIRA
jgi:hypothetical protein